jgi:hypothetical protein
MQSSQVEDNEVTKPKTATGTAAALLRVRMLLRVLVLQIFASTRLRVLHLPVAPRPTRVTMNVAARRARLLCKRSR